MNPLIIANWKMNPVTLKEAERLFGTVKKEIEEVEGVEVVVCPPFAYLPKIISLAGDLAIGAQNCFYQEKGAYTGEVSPLMLKDLGCQYIIVGHSERRKYFQETDEVVNNKLKIVLKNLLKPILCIGEEARDAFNSSGRPVNEMSLVVGEQLAKDLNGISASRVVEITIAYEPIWAIGTGLPCLSDDAMKAVLFIRKTLTNLYNRSVAERVRILYGGSVTSQNVIDYVKGINMNGVLVGAASLNASEFAKIVKRAI